jgi:UDP:flavonoid glycosyltransferase YjiC (YdhE family)
VLLCTSNGVGLGHLTRVMAVARQLESDVHPVIFTLSAAVAIPVAEGFHVEHLPSVGHAGLQARRWHDLLEDRVDHLVRTYGPRLVMFDGVHPYAGFLGGLAPHRTRVVRVWQRRAMWKPGVGVEAMTTERRFHHVVEPGEYAAPYDTGATVARRTAVRTVRPIVYGGSALDRVAACAELGLDPAGTHALVQLGAGAINDVSSLTGQVVGALRRIGGFTITVARSELTAGDADDHPEVQVVRRFPISRWFAAFDLAVLAAGYNSFHEALASGLPTLFVPNLATRTDDQDARSRWAVDRGMGERWDGADPRSLMSALERLADPLERSRLRERLGKLEPADGAAQVAELVRGWL